MKCYFKLFIVLPGPASQKKLHKGTKGAVAWGRSWFEKMRRYLRKYLDNGDTMLRLHFGRRWTGTNLQRQPHQHRLVYVLSDFAASSWPINCARGHIIGRQTLKPWAWSAVGFSACRSAVCQLQCYYGHRLLITDTRRHAAILTLKTHVFSWRLWMVMVIAGLMGWCCYVVDGIEVAIRLWWDWIGLGGWGSSKIENWWEWWWSDSAVI